MKIMVFDVPAENGGALEILNQYIDRARKDRDNKWIFILGRPFFKNEKNIVFENHAWTKKNWINRLWFDNFFAKSIVNKYSPDIIISLQNTIIRARGVPQTLYVHQSLPFIEKQYSFKENFKFWLYQHPIAQMIKWSVQHADNIIVQTKWMRKAVSEKCNVPLKKIKVESPAPDTSCYPQYERNNGKEELFFYPASAASYKNHVLLYKVFFELYKKGIENFSLILTLKEPPSDCDKYAETLKTRIKYIGTISHTEVLEIMSHSILLFPSYVETFGLPLLEAKMVGSPIVASDCMFSHEILDGYEKAIFCNPFLKGELLTVLKKMLCNNGEYI